MIRIGTDCSGIEAPIQALIQMGISHEHVFSSDIDKYVIKSIKANYKPNIIFGDKDGPYTEGDITKRKIEDVPDMDIYICGFPCQPFSIAGERKGFEDKRGNVFFSCLKVIKKKKPKVFILENVKGLLWHNKENRKDKYGSTFTIIISELKKLKEYKVYWKVLNTKDYGIPQNRERIYIVGLQAIYMYNEFEWPEKIKTLDLENFIDKEDTKKQNIPPCSINMFKNLPKNSVFIDISFTQNKYYNSHIYSPTVLTINRLWCVPKQRYANYIERLRLQGFPEDINLVVSISQINKQIGNSMSVNVLKEIFRNIFQMIL